MPQFDLPEAELAGYRCSTPTPAGLMQFWQYTLDEARAQGWLPKIEATATGLRLIDTYDVTFAGFGGDPIKAWYRRPAGVDASLPVVIRYQGYGGGRNLAHMTSVWPLAGYATLDVDNRGQGSGGGHSGHTPDPAGSGPSAPGFTTRGIMDRETYYYRRLFTDAALAVDAARELPGVDGTRVAVMGTSQGGGTALAVAGLVPGLSAVMADVPFLCDVPRGVALATRPPYDEIVSYLATHPGHAATVFEVLAHFDCSVLVRSAEAAALLSVALMDATCPPSTVYAAYNDYSGPKELRVYPFSGHEGGMFHQEAEQLRWLNGILPTT